MGSTSKHGRAVINPSNPRAVGICDRCGFLYNLETLQFQWDWAGTSMINKHLLVCRRCYDLPQEQLRAIVLPPDPTPKLQPRVEPYLIDEEGPTQLTRAQMDVPSLPVAALFLDLTDIDGTSILEALTGSPLRQDFAALMGAPSGGFSFNTALIRFVTIAQNSADAVNLVAFDAASGGAQLGITQILPTQTVTMGSGFAIPTGGLRLN